ncbi:amidohydrolase [Pseudomonas sp. RIT-PI-S]|uniref:amidohydrolase n=1 Tax=Pseudomonas sp. RIT-PI-S TaxID=3035295 RepID=UPI0021D9D588|nr:amidohydrolase [Pseudomonas sp. RIT-PI-S]
MKMLIPALLSMGVALSCGETMAAPSLILHGGKIYTAEPATPLQQAIAIENGKVLAVGSDQAILGLRGATTEVVDLQGKVLMPGLIDSHSHAIRGGLQLGQTCVDGNLLPFDQLQQRLRDGIADGKAKRGDTFIVCGLPSSYWSELPKFSRYFDHGEWADKPVLFLGWDQHTGWANRAMLRRAGVDAAYVRGLSAALQETIGQDAHGQPNGFLADDGLYALMDHLPPLSHAALVQGAHAAIDYYHSLGVTAWMDPTANDAPGQALTNQSQGMLPIYKELADRGELNVHVAALMLVDSKATPADLDDVAKVREQFADVPNLTIPGIKVFADGVPEYPAQTAAMLEPYRGTNKSGELLLDPATYPALVDAADARGWLVHVHALGDRATRVALDGVAQARKARQSGVPHSITHLQMVSPQDYDRFKQLDVIASMQLFWASADENSVDLVQPYVSPALFEHQYPARSLADHGATIAGASDWPVTTPDPWQAIYQAITRKGPKGVLAPTERLDRDTMLRVYTANAARAIRLENSIGSLKPGKQADMVLLDRDVFRVPVEALRETRALRTWFAGREVYSRPNASEQ